MRKRLILGLFLLFIGMTEIDAIPFFSQTAVAATKSPTLPTQWLKRFHGLLHKNPTKRQQALAALKTQPIEQVFPALVIYWKHQEQYPLPKGEYITDWEQEQWYLLDSLAQLYLYQPKSQLYPQVFDAFAESALVNTLYPDSMKLALQSLKGTHWATQLLKKANGDSRSSLQRAFQIAWAMAGESILPQFLVYLPEYIPKFAGSTFLDTLFTNLQDKPKALVALLPYLNHSEDMVRHYAGGLLIALNKPDILPQTLELLKHTQPRYREAAIRTLMRTEESLPMQKWASTIVPFLQDPDPKTRQQAYQYMTWFAGPQWLSEIQKNLQNQGSEIEYIPFYLATFAPEAQLPSLFPFLNKQNDFNRSLYQLLSKRGQAAAMLRYLDQALDQAQKKSEVEKFHIYWQGIGTVLYDHPALVKQINWKNYPNELFMSILNQWIEQSDKDLRDLENLPSGYFQLPTVPNVWQDLAPPLVHILRQRGEWHGNLATSNIIPLQALWPELPQIADKAVTTCLNKYPLEKWTQPINQAFAEPSPLSVPEQEKAQAVFYKILSCLHGAEAGSPQLIQKLLSLVAIEPLRRESTFIDAFKNQDLTQLKPALFNALETTSDKTWVLKILSQHPEHIPPELLLKQLENESARVELGHTLHVFTQKNDLEVLLPGLTHANPDIRQAFFSAISDRPYSNRDQITLERYFQANMNTLPPERLYPIFQLLSHTDSLVPQPWLQQQFKHKKTDEWAIKWIEWLTKHQSPNAIPDILALFHKHKPHNSERSDVFRAAYHALSRLQHPSIRPFVLEQLKQPMGIDPEDVFALTQIAQFTDVPLLLRLLQDSNWRIRNIAVQTLWHLKGSQILPQIQFLLHDAHSDIATRVVWWLGESKDPKYIKSLLPLLGHSRSHLAGQNLIHPDQVTLIKAQVQVALQKLSHPVQLPLIEARLQQLSPQQLAPLHNWWLSLLRQHGQFEQARQWLQQHWQSLPPISRMALAEAHGELREKELPDLMQAFRRQASLAERWTFEPFEARLLLLEAEFCLRQGKHTQAAMLQPQIDAAFTQWFTEQLRRDSLWNMPWEVLLRSNHVKGQVAEYGGKRDEALALYRNNLALFGEYLKNPKILGQMSFGASTRTDPNLGKELNELDGLYETTPQVQAGFPVAYQSYQAALRLIQKSDLVPPPEVAAFGEWLGR